MRKSALLFFSLVVTLLVTLGFVILSSASATKNVDPYFYMKRQFISLAIGLLAGTFLALFDYHRWGKHWSLVAIFGAVIFAMLLAVFCFKPINGSYRWIPLGAFNFQPSEFAKLATVMLVAIIMDKAGWRVELFRRGALYPSIIVGLMAVPVALEEDFGAALIIGTVGLLVMFIAGLSWRYVGILLIVGGAFLGYKVAGSENRIRRLTEYMNAHSSTNVVSLANQSASVYQSNHSLVAFHNGGIWGVGLGESMQKNHFLPEAHTDFVFAIGAEECGLPFSIAVIILFFSFFGCSVYFARHAEDRFGKFIIVGMSYIVFAQAMVNLGVVSEALPTKGMALPFFSYGGTNLIASCIAVGMIFSVCLHSNTSSKRRVLSSRLRE